MQGKLLKQSKVKGMTQQHITAANNKGYFISVGHRQLALQSR